MVQIATHLTLHRNANAGEDAEKAILPRGDTPAAMLESAAFWDLDFSQR